MIMRISQTGNRGFTLLELVVAMTIGSIIMTAVYGTFNTAMKARTRSIKILTPLREARFVCDLFRKDANNFHPLGEIKDLVCSPGSCSFPIRTDNGKKNLVRYELNVAGELTRQVETDSAPQRMLLSRNVETAEFSPKFKTDKKHSSMAMLVTLVLTFNHESKKENFSHNVFFELGPQN